MRSAFKALSATAISGCTLAFLALPAHAAVVEGAASSAFGVKVHATLLGRELVSVPATPFAQAPNADGDNSDSRTIAGPIRVPADGSLVSDIRALSVTATRSQTGRATARGDSQVSNVALLEQGASGPLVAADVIHSVSATTCNANGTATASAAGSRLVGLKVGATSIDVVPPPNTVIPLVSDGGTPADPTDDRGVKVILNEQTGASSGTGLIVTMIHVIVYDSVSSNVVFADIRIADARSTVYCSAGAPPTDGNGTDRGVDSDKVATSTTSDVRGATDGTEATVHRGETVTWTFTLTNKGTTGCGIVVASDTLPRHFTFVSSKGDLTKAIDPIVEGQTITWKNPARYSLPAGGKLTETIVAAVDKDAPFGTYLNLVEIDETTCSSFTQGLRGPVTVIPGALEVKGVKGVKPPAPGPLASTGSETNPLHWAFSGLGLMGLGLVISRKRQSREASA